MGRVESVESIFAQYEDLLKGAGRIKDEKIQKKAQSLAKSLNYFKRGKAQSSIHLYTSKAKYARNKTPNSAKSYLHNVRELATDSRIELAEQTQSIKKVYSPNYAIDTPEKNEYYGLSLQELRQWEAKARLDYLQTHKQAMQKKAQVIKESIVNLNEHHTMQDLKELTNKLRKEFGIRALHIAIHRDEGHYNQLTKEKHYNFHAHILFANYDFTTHRSVFRKFHKKDLSRMQDITAQSLGMQRGKQNHRKHINRYQLAHKSKKELENIKTLSQEFVNALKEQSFTQNLSPFKDKPTQESRSESKINTRSNTMDTELQETKTDIAQLNQGEKQDNEQEVNQPSLPFGDDYIECKAPKQKDEHADKILKDYERNYQDIDKVVSMIQKAEQGINKEPQQEAKENIQEQENEQEVDSSTIDKAVNDIQHSRNVFDILKCLYDLEKGMFELGIGKKPDIKEFMDKLNNMKDKALDLSFIKESVNQIKDCKDKLQDFSKNIKLERKLANQLKKDIDMHDLINEPKSKSEYVKRIDKKYKNALDQCPNFKIDFPKMCKEVEQLTQNKSKEQNQNKGVER